jgi:hypothetical protein
LKLGLHLSNNANISLYGHIPSLNSEFHYFLIKVEL